MDNQSLAASISRALSLIGFHMVAAYHSQRSVVSNRLNGKAWLEAALGKDLTDREEKDDDEDVDDALRTNAAPDLSGGSVQRSDRRRRRI